MQRMYGFKAILKKSAGTGGEKRNDSGWGLLAANAETYYFIVIFRVNIGEEREKIIPSK